MKSPPAVPETWVQSLGQGNPLEKGIATHPSILAQESHGQRSLVGYSSWGPMESDMTEPLTPTPQASAVESILAKSCTLMLGRVLGPARCEKREYSWSKVNKHLEGLTYINDLFM